MTVKVAKDGEWIQPRKRNYTLVCCDCRLTHRMDFRIRDGHIQFRAFRCKRRAKVVLG